MRAHFKPIRTPVQTKADLTNIINEQHTEIEILRFEIEQLKRYVKARSAERDFAEKQLGRIRRALA
jgi:hypothetical protein|tara:strand:- start:454 stop:651 length:198 start_codon:yes stop_codon:yes gene_type:complete